ncbi:MAG: hypothetical protein ACPHN2_10620 [Sinimarinibacterium flocculans]|uniref:hypothetical protein n=1 Tax=Sinimarinibacterium flocculans TaxID=985250 RepID=UPI003C5C31F4
MVNEKNLFVAQVCHIQAAEPKGERFDPNQSDEQRRSYDNLILLCYPHHVETDDSKQYSTERLRLMKADHERVFGQKLFQIDERLLHKVSAEMERYWSHIDHLHREHHVVSELAIEIDVNATYLTLANQATALVTSMSEIQDYLIESERLKAEQEAATGTEPGPNDFEMLYLGLTNTITKLSVTLVQMEIRYLEEFIKLNPSDSAARQRLEERKSEFAQLATGAGYAD